MTVRTEGNVSRRRRSGQNPETIHGVRGLEDECVDVFELGEGISPGLNVDNLQ
jgi:hypothetical protein